MFPSNIDPESFIYSNVWNVCEDAILELYIDKDIIQELYIDKDYNINLCRLNVEKKNDDIKQKITKNIQNSIKLIEEYFYTDNQNINYANILLQLARNITPNFTKNYISEKWGMRQMTYKVIPLDMIDIYTKILKNKSDYYISPKIDGERCIMYYDTNYDDNNLYIITHKLIKLKILNEKINSICIIADAELIKTENKIDIHIFDIMHYDPGYISKEFCKSSLIENKKKVKDGKIINKVLFVKSDTCLISFVSQ